MTRYVGSIKVFNCGMRNASPKNTPSETPYMSKKKHQKLKAFKLYIIIYQFLYIICVYILIKKIICKNSLIKRLSQQSF